MTYMQNWSRYNHVTGVTEHCVWNVMDDGTVIITNQLMEEILAQMGFSPVEVVDNHVV